MKPSYARPSRRRQNALRRQAIVDAYLSGQFFAQEVADQFGITRNTLHVNLNRWGVKLPEEERRRRMMGGNHRRPPIWPDCPPHLREDYDTLRRYMPAGEARAKLEGHSP